MLLCSLLRGSALGPFVRLSQLVLVSCCSLWVWALRSWARWTWAVAIARSCWGGRRGLDAQPGCSCGRSQASAHRWLVAACEPHQQGWAFVPLAMLGGTFRTRGPDGLRGEGPGLASPGVAPLSAHLLPDPLKGARLQASLICYVLGGKLSLCFSTCGPWLPLPFPEVGKRNRSGGRIWLCLLDFYTTQSQFPKVVVFVGPRIAPGNPGNGQEETLY